MCLFVRVRQAGSYWRARKSNEPASSVSAERVTQKLALWSRRRDLSMELSRLCLGRGGTFHIPHSAVHILHSRFRSDSAGRHFQVARLSCGRAPLLVCVGRVRAFVFSPAKSARTLARKFTDATRLSTISNGAAAAAVWHFYDFPNWTHRDKRGARERHYYCARPSGASPAPGSLVSLS